MNDNPIVILITVAIAVYILKIWLDDYRAFQRGEPNPNPLPGATPVPMWVIWLSVLGSVLLVGVETAGEAALGVVDEQSTVRVAFLLSMIAAGIVEEMVFRGFAVVRGKGRALFLASIVGGSLLFALIHAHLLGGGEDEAIEGAAQAALLPFEFDLSPAAIWWTGILFLNSLWWYTVRFLPANTHSSLLPCFAGHIASNVAVFGVKLAQGFVTW